MTAWSRRGLAAVVMLFVAACQGSVTEFPDPTLEPANSARLILYRSNAWVQAAEIPFFYLDDKDLGKLGRGDVIIRQVPAGAHSITAQRPVLFMPAQTMGAVTVHFEAGKTHYLRFSYDDTGMGSTYVTATGGLSEVDEAAYIQRR